MSEHRRVGDVIGDSIDLAPALDAENAALNQFNFNLKTTKSSGVAAPDSIPKVEVLGGNELDFGTMKVGTERSHAFRIKNAGKAPLALTVKGSTCKCTIGSLEKSELEPEEETQVTLTWKAEGILKDFAQTATIGTNDPRQLEVLLSIKGKIGRTYVLSTEELSFGDFSARDSFTKNFQLFSSEESELIVSGHWADADQPRVAVESAIRKLDLASNEFPDHADARYVADFKVIVSPGLPAGPLNGQVFIEVGPEKTPLALRCSGKCVSDLRIIPQTNYDAKYNTLSMGKFSSAEGGSKRFLIAARNPADRKVELKLKKIIPDSLKGSFEVEIGEPEENNAQTLFPITVKIPKGTPAFNRGGTTSTNFIKLFFETNLDVSNEIAVNVKLVVEE